VDKITLVTKSSSVHSISVDEAFDNFINQRKNAWRKNSSNENSFRMSYYPILKASTGQIKTGDITKQHISDFLTIILNLPANKTKISAYKNQPITNFIKNKIPEKDQISQSTKKKYIRAIGSFLKWLKRNDHTEIDLDAPLYGFTFIKTKDNEKRDRFTDDDLRKLFNSKEYVQGTHKEASHFWVPLLGLFTGARLNEICQLGIDDIYIEEETKMWVFDINKDENSDPNKSLKQDYHYRVIPIHKKLIELGFLEYHESQSKNKRLFPDLLYISSNNKYGDQLQRWFNRTYKNRCKITTPNTSFHSFRHTLLTYLINEKGCNSNKIATSFGQSPEGNVTQTTYVKRMEDIRNFPIFDLFDFSHAFDIKKIRHWKYHAFNRK